MQDRSSTGMDCPPAPPADASVYARTMHRACLVLGGVDCLAGHLEVTSLQVQRWLRGEDKPAEAAFLACVEIVLLQADAPATPN